MFRVSEQRSIYSLSPENMVSFAQHPTEGGRVFGMHYHILRYCSKCNADPKQVRETSKINEIIKTHAVVSQEERSHKWYGAGTLFQMTSEHYFTLTSREMTTWRIFPIIPLQCSLHHHRILILQTRLPLHQISAASICNSQ